jgi:hypothetical protein
MVVFDEDSHDIMSILREYLMDMRVLGQDTDLVRSESEHGSR